MRRKTKIYCDLTLTFKEFGDLYYKTSDPALESERVTNLMFRGVTVYDIPIATKEEFQNWFDYRFRGAMVKKCKFINKQKVELILL